MKSDLRVSDVPHTDKRESPNTDAQPQTGEPTRQPRVVVADDSAFMRRLIADSLMRRGVSVLAEVTNGRQAVEACAEHHPDVLCLDLAMPELDGIAVLRELARAAPGPGNRPIRTVVISSFSEESGMQAVDALAAGAFDLVPKLAGRGKLGEFTDQVVRTVLAAYEAPVPLANDVGAGPVQADARPAPPNPVPRTRPATATKRVVLVASSTGGPRALTDVLPALPGSVGQGVIVVQHMPAGFTRSLATRLDDAGQIKVVEVQGGEHVASGTALVAPGGRHLRIRRGRVEPSDEAPVGGLRPCADVTIADAVAEFGGDLLLVVLTGMGRDGLEGARQVREAGGVVLAQDAATCTVFGMPRAVIEAGLANEVVPIDEMAAAIVRWADA
jgi:two-component system chemotaxis response regulator CheB